jgi:hypothetical protein
MKWCPTGCGHYIRAEDEQCTDCRRRRAWGTVNRAILELTDGTERDQRIVLGALEAIGLLMQERQALVYRYNREALDEQRATNRAARESYDQGRNDERREGRGDW